MAGEMEPAEDMDQTEPDSTVGEIFDLLLGSIFAVCEIYI